MNRNALTLILALCLAPLAMLTSPAIAATQPSRADVSRYAQDLLSRNYPADGPGAVVLVARGDKVLFRAARGEADIGTHTPLRPDSVFRIGSLTKQFTAAGLLKLVEAGRVGLDDPLSKYLPDFPGGDAITVLQLLNHTSGVADYSSLPGFSEETIRQDMITAQIIGLFRDKPPAFAPGANWAYDNSGYVLAGAVIEAVTGQPWYAYLEQALFRPLGLRDTGYAADPRFAGRQVRGYSYEDGAVAAMRPMSMTQPHAAGALVSTVDDLFKWSRALHEGRVLKDDAYRQMTIPAGRAAAPGIGYGFGLYAGRVRLNISLWHGGHIFGFTAAMIYLPGPDITVVVLENDDADNSPDSAVALARKLAAMALGDPYPKARAIPVDTATLQAAQGVYRFGEDISRVLRLVDGKLTAQRGAGPRAVLTPIGIDDLLYEDGFSRLRIERDPAGRITGVRFFANGDGPGEIGARTDEPLPGAPVGLSLPPAVLDRLAGAYANGGFVLKIYVDGGVLKAQLADQPALDLRATTPTRFEVDQTGATLEFPAGDAPAAEVTMRQSGREMTLSRTP